MIVMEETDGNLRALAAIIRCMFVSLFSRRASKKCDFRAALAGSFK
jgi:hypothetical protein